MTDNRVVVAIDFGTTFSGFAYANRTTPEIITNDIWPQQIGPLKTNTVLQYDENYRNVLKWGNPALAQRQSRRNKNSNASKPVELFKLHLGNISQSEKPPLPYQLSHEKAITDYLRELVASRWYGLDFFENVFLVISIPAEFDDFAKDTMRKCLYGAGLTASKESKKVEFTTEPASIYCMRNLKEHKNALIPVNASFMVVDCGGGTVDLTTRKLLNDEKLSEITERTGDFCGGTYVDREFLKFLGLKFHFTGNLNEFDPYELDIEEVCPILKQYCKDDVKEEMEDNEWIIDVNFEDLKSMFDPVVGKIIRLIRGQLNSSQSKCSAMFIVGGFSESKYLQMRVRQEFKELVPAIIVPKQPIAAIVRDRTLKHTYGIRVLRDFKDGDPESQIYDKKNTYRFSQLVSRGTKVDVDQEFSHIYCPRFANATSMRFLIYITTELSGEFCDEPGMKRHGTLRIDLPDVHLGKMRNVELSLIFGKMELVAKAKNLQNGKIYETSFDLLL
ncbi:16304_t:CDS:2 [Funneliformis mosseae]|uniref:16304_t:CDS:1 n=1 Tax=Funneliformis mosseae TaxID=27381 RepID=A0A9N9GHG8_FUNMO|nr:16304_t:CDS:2 [Funneliformis mosseae]